MARRRLLLLAKSYFARGGTGAEPGVTSPRGLRELRRNAGSGAAPALPPAGETRASPGRAPRAPRRLCSPPRLRRLPPPLWGSGGGKGDPAPFAALFQKPDFETRESGEQCGQTAEDGRRHTPAAPAEVRWGQGPEVEGPPQRLRGARRGECASTPRRRLPASVAHRFLFMK